LSKLSKKFQMPETLTLSQFSGLECKNVSIIKMCHETKVLYNFSFTYPIPGLTILTLLKPVSRLLKNLCTILRGS